jgi:hypothetical protein
MQICTCLFSKAHTNLSQANRFHSREDAYRKDHHLGGGVI